MITIETALRILKDDHNFREVIKAGHYHFNASGKSFTKLSYDSRTCDGETLFFVKGANFKKAFLDKAVEQGLTYYVSEVDYEVAIPVILVNDIKQAMSLIAMAFYDRPQDKLKLIGFTGTKGKTTAAYFAYHILKENHKPAMLSTMQTTLDGEHFFKSELTTPESLDLFAMMAQAVANGMTHLIMEVSSQAYLVKRVYGLTFDVGIFLNISPDHIGPIEHPTFEDYFYHKRQLLENARYTIVNQGMAHFDLLKEQVQEKPHAFYGKGSDNAVTDSQALSFTLTGSLAGTYSLQLLGDFNQENAVAAALACHKLGASQAAIQAGIAKTTVPGRMEILTATNGARIFVDYAHNGISLESLISVVEPHHQGRISLIIGSTGNKAESRRKDFADVINAHPQLAVILTADDPNREDPAAIAQEIASHITRPVTIEVDREKAIQLGVSQLHQPEDALIIAGKGADAFQIVNGQRVAYPGDAQVARTYLH
ncbi:UDP-N-acetylmuramoyl-L-alanyl-D-glutamate--L-lysine ligase [Streptococcus sp. DD12]|uniref:UDP-N-acetylmuramoyl-L-alanyl-D-glutamate--L- lysine ligase n=1 Tax=Streptococcus sp. DD12 TaxID=1777880 RepID=UPI0007935122|nr:UDP-N-acetylmuramoyl-L-alanyl-D-glutamate--L-lysine ligase [Streptococcus sp. DD12]KXT75934.1 UDP-N-acetylmuramoylalanyl-D-glutamate--L- lysine ligase [Streptococcus sp. DD12]